MTVLISIPAFNEEKTIGNTLDDIHSVMNKTSYNYNIQVLDDGSTDQTVKEAQKHGATVYSSRRNQGLAKNFLLELKYFLASPSTIFVHTDADGQYDPEAIPHLIREVENGHDLVLGSRFKGKVRYKNDFSRMIGNMIFAKAISAMTHIRITDSTTGFRAFTREVAESIDFINTFTYTQEQIIKAARQGFSISEIPIRARKTRESRLFSNPFQYAWKAWINILRIYRDYDPLRFFGRIGLSLCSLGIAIGVFFIYLHFTSGIQGHVPLLLLMILLFLTGLQVIVFGFLADMR